MKATYLASTALTLATLAGSAWADSVKYGWNGLAEELFQGYVIAEGLRQLGYDVGAPDQMQVPLAHTAVATGDIQYYPAHWTPLHDAFWSESGGDEKLMRVGSLVDGNVQGFLIDKKTADETGIKFLEDLQDPAKAALFDIDGNGKADLFGCDPGWGCERVIETYLDALNLRETVEHKQGAYFSIIAEAIERIQSGQPALYYTWTPSWLSGVLVPGSDVMYLNVKETHLPDGQSGNTEVEGIGNVGFPVNDTKIIANTEWLAENAKAKKFFELLTIPIADVNTENMQIYKGESSEEQIMKHATDWIAANQAQWDKWIAEASAAK